MNILGIFLNNTIRTGGDRRYLELMEELAGRGNRVFVIMNSLFDYTPVHLQRICIPVSYTYRGFPPASWLFRHKIKANLPLIKNAIGPAVDFLHIHGDTHLKAALFLRKKFGLPLFYAFRCNDIDRARILRKSGGLTVGEYLFSVIYDPVNRHREKLAARYASLITFQNDVDRQLFLRRTSAASSKTVIIPGNIGPPRCKPEYKNKNQSTEVKKILYVGVVSSSKGLWDLLAALTLVKKSGLHEFTCSVLGRGDQTRTKDFIKKLNIQDHIRFEGFKDPFPFLASCDLMVYPTLYDAFPDTVLEALHTGCPVLASAVGGLPDMLQYDELLFPANDVRKIADKIKKCMADKKYYDSVRALCHKRAQVYHFDWAERFEKAMRDYTGK
ncbi:MAG: glycosyltransferase family 4 protein [Spirochaetaceae bacterium]|jgi:glycosyltransferase involved in cell wall biosynthesis|nr:glycosyltransferase family 4 protein [Spirochaetaceae bacterium]